MPPPELSAVRKRLELGRLLLGSVLEWLIKAYGAGAALSVALSDSETASGKAGDAIRAVPNLADKYHQGRYVLDHREEIQAAVTYLNEHTLPEAELQQQADQSLQTLGSIETTYDKVGRARDALQFDGIQGTFDNVREAIGHIGSAYSARPDLDSIRRLAEVADQVEPFKEQVDVLIPVYYGNFFTLTDNFASDEIASTLTVMALAIAVSVVLGRVVGFWVRRGRPGIVARLLQHLGARTFPKWYARHLPYALGAPLYDHARVHVQDAILDDPRGTLDDESYRRLEEHFSAAADPSSAAPRPR